MTKHSHRPVVLLIEDDPGDILMIIEALEGIGKPRDIHVTHDGQEGLDFLSALASVRHPHELTDVAV